MYGGAVYRSDARGHAVKVVDVDDNPSGIGFLPTGDLIFTSMNTGTVQRVVDGASQEQASVRELTPYMINDMYVTKDGRAYVGEFGFDYVAGDEPKPGDLLTITPEGDVSVAARGLSLPNGIVISPDGKTLLVAESMASVIAAFDVSEDGSLSNRRVWGEAPGFLDGLCLDAAGGLWIGVYDKEQFVRMVEGGEVTDRVELPGRFCMAPALGGPDGTTLFMATTNNDASDFTKADGRIETVKVNYPGA